MFELRVLDFAASGSEWRNARGKRRELASINRGPSRWESGFLRLRLLDH